jgi:hypothetical protein
MYLTDRNSPESCPLSVVNGIPISTSECEYESWIVKLQGLYYCISHVTALVTIKLVGCPVHLFLPFPYVNS